MWGGLLVRLPSSIEREQNTVAMRVEICPPAVLADTRGGWIDRLLDWLGQGWHGTEPADETRSAPPSGVTPLVGVRLEFVDCLADIPTRQAADLVERIRRARSLRELWHLRTEVFSIVSCHSDQREARERMTRLNRHFPARAPRSGFGEFDALPRSPRG